MATLGSAGANRNFAPGFTVAGTQVLVGYTCGGASPTNRLYSSVDIKRDIPQTKFAAVRAAADALGAKIQLLPGSWPMTTRGAKGFRLFLSHPHASSKTTAWNAAGVTTALTNIETAITT